MGRRCLERLRASLDALRSAAAGSPQCGGLGRLPVISGRAVEGGGAGACRRPLGCRFWRTSGSPPVQWTRAMPRPVCSLRSCVPAASGSPPGAAPPKALGRDEPATVRPFGLELSGRPFRTPSRPPPGPCVDRRWSSFVPLVVGRWAVERWVATTRRRRGRSISISSAGLQ